MSFNLEVFLVVSTAITGAVVLLHKLLRKRSGPGDEHSWMVGLCRSFFPILLIVLVFRSFAFEPFRIPSGSMLPTLHVGDFILVEKFSYGLRLPVLHYGIFNTGEPERGDVIVFRFPPDPSQTFIKRLIGLPGDRIVYSNGQLEINGDKIKLTQPDSGADKLLFQNRIHAREHLPGAEHSILLKPGSRAGGREWRVPAQHYFVMGDNRDNSNDSREWGFVPENRLVGRASFIWLHWDWGNSVCDMFSFDMDFPRFGQRII